jgi:predicted dienelactone hydrolase
MRDSRAWRDRIVCGAIALVLSTAAGAGAYDPLRLGAGAVPADLVVRDAARSREVPLRVYRPASAAPAPVVLFSHGLGGSREGSAYLGEHWAGRGYVAAFLQHAGSDSAVWQGVPRDKRLEVLTEAASGRNLVLRAGDVSAVLDQLEAWNRTSGHPLAGALDLARLGMSGHSFGAVTTQAVSGQSIGRGGARFTDRRIKAALALSPSSPRQGDPKVAFGSVTIPWMLMTGTRDVSPIRDIDVASRLAVFSSLQPGDKYELVLEGAEHSAFGDRALPGERGPRNPNHHRAILALSTAFWDAHLRGDAAARDWLRGAGPRSVLEGRDRWQVK